MGCYRKGIFYFVYKKDDGFHVHINGVEAVVDEYTARMSFRGFVDNF